VGFTRGPGLAEPVSQLVEASSLSLVEDASDLSVDAVVRFPHPRKRAADDVIQLRTVLVEDRFHRSALLRREVQLGEVGNR
jgi:hypothetical protein